MFVVVAVVVVPSINGVLPFFLTMSRLFRGRLGRQRKRCGGGGETRSLALFCRQKPIVISMASGKQELFAASVFHVKMPSEMRWKMVSLSYALA